MKKTLKIFLVAALVILVASCAFACLPLQSQDDPNADPEIDGGTSGETDNQGSVDKPVAKEKLSYEQKEALLDGRYGAENNNDNSYYGIGRTLNVITDEYIKVSAGYTKVFDTDSLLNLNWNKTYTGKMNANTAFGSSMSEIYGALNVGYEKTIGGSANFIDIFSAGLETSFGFSAGLNYKQTANEIYYTFSQSYAARLIEIDEYFDISQFQSILSEKVLKDAQSVQDGAMSASQFIKKYGTHAILAGYYGGQVSCNYYLRNKGTQWNATAEANYKSSVNAAIQGIFSANAGTTFSISAELGLSSNEVEEHFSASSLGGKNFQSASLKDFINNYGIWAKSMNETTEYGNLVALPQRSLVAIWDMFPSEYSKAKEILSSYFIEEANKTSAEFLSKYERSYTAPDEPELPNTYFISTRSLSCKLDSGYNYDKIDPNGNNYHYSHDFEFGKFVITGSGKKESGTNEFNLCNGYGIDVAFRLEYDADNLPVQDNMTSRFVHTDSKQSGFYNLPWNVGERDVKMGMIVALVEYSDGSPSEKICLTDAFNGIKGGQSVAIVNNISKPCKISIAICYELEQWAPGFLGISDNYWMNWRINQTLIIK